MSMINFTLTSTAITNSGPVARIVLQHSVPFLISLRSWLGKPYRLLVLVVLGLNLFIGLRQSLNRCGKSCLRTRDCTLTNILSLLKSCTRIRYETLSINLTKPAKGRTDLH